MHYAPRNHTWAFRDILIGANVRIMGASLIRYEPYTAPYNYEEAVNIVTTRKWLFLRGQGWKPVFKWKSLNILWEILSYTRFCHYIWTKSWQQYSLNTQYFMILESRVLNFNSYRMETLKANMKLYHIRELYNGLRMFIPTFAHVWILSDIPVP